MASIYLLLEEEQQLLVGDIEDPVEAWKVLSDAYEPSSRARIASLWLQFINLKNADRWINEHFPWKSNAVAYLSAKLARQLTHHLIACGSGAITQSTR